MGDRDDDELPATHDKDDRVGEGAHEDAARSILLGKARMSERRPLGARDGSGYGLLEPRRNVLARLSCIPVRRLGQVDDRPGSKSTFTRSFAAPPALLPGRRRPFPPG